jgi:hypothetical protein
MASIIIGSAILVGTIVHERKEKKMEKARLAEEQYTSAHGQPTLVTRQKKQVATPELPSYDSVVSQQNNHGGRTRDEKERRLSEDSQTSPPRYQ